MAYTKKKWVGFLIEVVKLAIAFFAGSQAPF